MSKYRKKPVVIDAVQYTSQGQFVHGMCDSLLCDLAGTPHVHTIHSGQPVILEVGDWIIPEPNCEPDGWYFYPCKPDIFEATYEAV